MNFYIKMGSYFHNPPIYMGRINLFNEKSHEEKQIHKSVPSKNDWKK
jgi:hypothetical protein